MSYSFQRIFNFLVPGKQCFVRKNLYSNLCSISELLKKKFASTETIKVKGWIKGTRKMKDLIFVDINDGSCASKLQIVIPKHLKPSNIAFGSSLEASGTVKVNPNNQLELMADSLKIIGTCDSNAGFPFAARKSYPDDYVRQFLHFRPRTSTFACVLRIRDAVTRGLHDILGQSGYVLVHTPILTSNDCEGAGEVFLVTPNSEKLRREMSKEDVTLDEAYFNSKAYLTVSGQLHLEAAVRGLSKVYTFGPVFRAENSRSRLHLSEFYMLEAELAFSEDLEDAMSLAEKLCRGAAARVLDQCGDDLTAMEKLTSTDIVSNLKKLVSAPAFTRLHYEEAVKILQANATSLEVQAPKMGENFSKEHELFLSKYFTTETGQPLVFVTHWPASIKPFYMKRSNTDQVEAFDLLGPVAGEVCGGSLREPCADTLEQRLLQLEGGKTVLKELQWYLDIRRHGNVPSSGFGLGFERFLQTLLGIANIKDTLPFPRWPHSLRM